MRVPSDPAVATAPRVMRRYQVGLLAGIVIIIVLLIGLQAGANFYTNYLWYRSLDDTAVWRSMVSTKLELAAFFCGIFFVACWASLWVVDRIAPRALFMSPELELVRRYQTTLGRHRVAVRTVVAALVALAIGAGTNAQWQHWLLFIHGGSFGVKDPLFHRDVGYFIFKLPFISFLVDWVQVALFILLVVSAVAHYFNGGLRFSGPSPRIDPRTTAHLSAILAALALLRAVAYFYVDRYALDLSSNGVVAGAGYTDVNVRLPALELLAVVALAAFVLLVYNVYYRSWTLPAVAVGLWALVALAIGVIFPAIVQLLQVNPSASTVELPYIQRNITATRYAMNLNGVTPIKFLGDSRATAADVLHQNASFQSVALWDPSNAGTTTQIQQSYRSYYSISGSASDRYVLGTGSSKTLTPVVISTRQVAAGQLSNPTWVNVHLQYTHGYAAVMTPANAQTASGDPVYDIAGVPPSYSNGAPQITQPDIYFGTGMSGYVVVDTKQPELDYEQQGGGTQSSHYDASAGGGIPVGGFWTRAAFALRFHDFNLLVSHLITPQSRIMFVQDVRARVERAAPFLTVDSHPYAVIDNGQIDWVMDAYTTSSYFPYGQPADTSSLPSGSGLAGNYNYVRDSVKAVVNAYTGKVTLYAMTTTDPILNAWEKAFPGMFKPRSAMDSTLESHLRYPQDLFSVQATMYGLYHVTSPSEFYGKENAWTIARPSSGSSAPVTPNYELLQLPGQSSVSFDAVVPMQPATATTNRSQTLTAFMVAVSTSSSYGMLAAYEIPGGTNVPSLATINAQMSSNRQVSKIITPLDQHGSVVVLGPTLLVPVDSSIVWIRSLFVASTSNFEPLLDYVIVDYAGTVTIEPTLLGPSGALAAVFGPTVSAIGTPNGQTSLPEKVRLELTKANSDYSQAQKYLSQGNIPQYISYLARAGSEVKLAYKYLLAYDKSHSGSSSGSVSPSSSGSGTGSGTGTTGTGASSSTSGTTGTGGASGSSTGSTTSSTSNAGTSGRGTGAAATGNSPSSGGGGGSSTSGGSGSSSVTTTTVDNNA